MDGGRCRVNSIRGGPRRLLRRISRDVNLRTYPTCLRFPHRPLFSRTMDTPINCIDALELAVPSSVSSFLLLFYFSPSVVHRPFSSPFVTARPRVINQIIR